MAFVVCATGFSLSLQAYTIGMAAAQDAAALHASPALLLLGLLPHAVPELAATIVIASVAVPTLIVCAAREVYVAPHILGVILGT